MRVEGLQQPLRMLPRPHLAAAPVALQRLHCSIAGAPSQSLRRPEHCGTGCTPQLHTPRLCTDCELPTSKNAGCPQSVCTSPLSLPCPCAGPCLQRPAPAHCITCVPTCDAGGQGTAPPARPCSCPAAGPGPHPAAAWRRGNTFEARPGCVCRGRARPRGAVGAGRGPIAPPPPPQPPALALN